MEHDLGPGAHTPRNLGYDRVMPASTTFRHKGGGARISVNLTPEGLKALEYLTTHGHEAKGAINQAIIAAARESWEENERQAREDAR